MLSPTVLQTDVPARETERLRVLSYGAATQAELTAEYQTVMYLTPRRTLKPGWYSSV